jgi:hypothetical protein
MLPALTEVCEARQHSMRALLVLHSVQRTEEPRRCAPVVKPEIGHCGIHIASFLPGAAPWKN